MSIQSTTPCLYLSAPHPCPYTDQTATTLVLDPKYPINTLLNTTLINAGFRRSGNTIYRPHCRNCKTCVSVRIPALEFKPNRIQKRTFRHNTDISVSIIPTQFRESHFKLYKRYQFWRHIGSEMAHDKPNLYKEYMVDSPTDTVLFEYRLQQQLVCVSICDLTTDGLSAVYTFFEPDLQRRSLGTFAILKQLEYVQSMQLDWFYLGYWIENCRKMSYKINFRPLFGYIDHEWCLIRK